MIRAAVAGVVLLQFTSACGSGESQPAEPAASVASTNSTASTTTAATEELVGRWEHINECPQLTKALAEEGLETIAPSVAGDYFPKSTPKQLAKKDDVCDGAEGFVHSHFFTDSGTFGSLTEDLEQVDDGHTRSSTVAAFGSGMSSFGMRSRATSSRSRRSSRPP